MYTPDNVPLLICAFQTILLRNHLVLFLSCHHTPSRLWPVKMAAEPWYRRQNGTCRDCRQTQPRDCHWRRRGVWCPAYQNSDGCYNITAFAVLDDVNVIDLIQSRKSPPFRIPGKACASQLSILTVIPHSHISFPCLHDGFSVFICSSA